MSNPAVFDDSCKDNEDFIPSGQCDDYVSETKKRKYKRKPKSSKDVMTMPERYCHIRSGERKVREEIYTDMPLLFSSTICLSGK